MPRTIVCELCDNLMQIKGEAYVKAFLNTEMCRLGKDILVHRAKGDNQDRSGNFVRHSLKLEYETCAAHAGPIMEKNRSNMKQFKAHAIHGTVQELWTKFHKFVKRVMLANSVEQAEFLQKKLVMWLHEKKQPTAAMWFETYWTGRRGRWTIAHAGHSNVHTNSSIEGHINQCKINWLGQTKNCSQNMTQFVGATFDDVKQRSIEHHNTLVMSDYGVAAFQKFSAVTPDMVRNLKNLHPYALWLTKAFFKPEVFQQGLNVVYKVDKDGIPTKYTRTVERVMQCIAKEEIIFAEPFLSMKNSLRNSFKFPSEKAMKRFDKQRNLHLQQLTDLFDEHRQSHVQMQMPGKMVRPRLGETTAYFLSLEEALQARELYHCIELAVNIDPRDMGTMGMLLSRWPSIPMLCSFHSALNDDLARGMPVELFR